ncbi:MAG TPA: glycosyl hydrolase 53 family protein [Ferruginibacter sp.]|nr:glycosyl hydrolase 53 family protein [Ferruginibacter sp.]
MKTLLLRFAIAGITLFFICCSKTPAVSTVPPPPPVVPPPPPAPDTSTVVFAKGADIGWLSEMEAAGKKFYNNSGTEQDCIELLKSKGINAIRLRVWVNPADGWCNAADVVKQAVRAKNAGMRIMIDFHYSDWWADPGKQNKPAAWKTLSFTELKAALAAHTTDVLLQLKTAGVTPEWVQVGNENDDGMLWEDGRASTNMNQFAALIQAGYDAVKAVSSNIKVIVHISNGWNNDLFRWIFDGLQANSTRYDIIAMSLYPTVNNWRQLNQQCLLNMNNMTVRYNKPVMISEVGMPWDAADTCQLFLKDIIAKNKLLPGNKGLGVFYWEPQCHNNWKGYTLGAFDNSGRPTVAMDAFKD